jgi:hypothetical protein
MKILNLGDEVELQDVDGKTKAFRVAGVNKVTYTIVCQWHSQKHGFQSISRSLRKDTWRISK